MHDAVPVDTVGRNIHDARKFMGMTREELAEIAVLAPSTVFRIEKGAVAPSVATLQRIAHALGVTVDHLLRDES